MSKETRHKLKRLEMQLARKAWGVRYTARCEVHRPLYLRIIGIFV